MPVHRVFVFGCFFLALSGLPASAAEVACKFDKECLGTEACQDSGFQLTLKFEADGGSIVSDAETVSGQPFGSDNGAVRGMVATRPSGDAHIVTIFENGKARYTAQMPSSDISMYYEGTCKGAE